MWLDHELFPGLMKLLPSGATELVELWRFEVPGIPLKRLESLELADKSFCGQFPSKLALLTLVKADLGQLVGGGFQGPVGGVFQGLVGGFPGELWGGDSRKLLGGVLSD